MSRILTLAAIGLAVGTAATLYQVKYEVRLLEQEARELHRGVTRERQSIQVLDAEWAFMNQPSRIQDLAERYLDLKPVKPTQITTIDRLPLRPVTPDIAPGSATPGDGLVAYAVPPSASAPSGVPMPTLRPQAGRAAPARVEPASAPAAASPQKPAPAMAPAAAKPAPAKPAAPAVPATVPARSPAPAPAPARPAAPPVTRTAEVPRATPVSATSYDDQTIADIDSLFANAEASYPTGRR
ncbi:cell division protein FtsL [Zavarzinia aquatilis]|uniref:cell division protein FtsL n=1 Tax=Zavarzinia aquatilis TaxID=2211142 RepID=UPI0010581352|nr:hypothetical protein [Zavarzinia aquatilis]